MNSKDTQNELAAGKLRRCRGRVRGRWWRDWGSEGAAAHAAGIDRSFVSVNINFQIERRLYNDGHVAKTIATDVHGCTVQTGIAERSTVFKRAEFSETVPDYLVIKRFAKEAGNRDEISTGTVKCFRDAKTVESSRQDD